jgi:flagellar biosynthesis/type III secretory pathway chaperone
VTPPQDIARSLREHLALCASLLPVLEQEAAALRQPEAAIPFEVHQAKKSLLPRLEQSVERLKAIRARWVALPPAERSGFPEVPGLLRQNQELIMKMIVLDRENEQALLRKGLVPAKHLPPAQRQRPHYVANLYQRQGTRPPG